MDPLASKDLLIRPGQPESADADSQEKAAAPSVKLERFQHLEHVIRDNPINADPYLELGKIYMQQSRWADARRVFDQAHARFPEVEEVTYSREEAQLSRSMQLLGEVKAEHEKYPTHLTQEKVDRSLLELNVLRETVCRARLARDPNQFELYIPLAGALEFLGKQAEAIAAFEKASSKPELRAAAALQLGFAQQRAGRIPEALSAFRRAAMFRVPPPPADIKLKALTAAADLAETSGLVDSARRYVRMLAELQPANAQLKQRLKKLSSMPL